MKKLLIPALFAIAGLASIAHADDAQCKATVTANGPMSFDIKEFSINKKDCAEFTVEIKNESKMPKASMGHNVVITKTADVEGVIADGQPAGAEKAFLKDGDTRIIAHTNLTGDGETDSVTFKTADLTAGGDYEFFCSFPGHYNMMKGKVNVTE